MGILSWLFSLHPDGEEKDCPMCGCPMDWLKGAWFCPHCGYEVEEGEEDE